MIKRYNSNKSVEIMDYSDLSIIDKRLKELKNDEVATFFLNEVFDSYGNIIDYGKDYNLYIVPQFGAEDKVELSYYAICVVPTFAAIAASPQGLKYLQTQFEIRTIKRIRDNLRLSIADGRTFILSTKIEEFISSPRSCTSIETEFKGEVAKLTKTLQAKFAKLLPAKLLLTQKTVLTAINNEAFAAKYLPFTITKDGTSIFGKWLEMQISKFEQDNKPVDDLKTILHTRLTAKLDENDDIELTFDELL